MSEMMNEPNNLISSKESFSDLMIFGACFLVLFPFALLGQLIGIHWKTWLIGSEDSQNIFMGIKSAVYTFMSHIN
jgi:light-harvesting complex 1 beta chain